MQHVATIANDHEHQLSSMISYRYIYVGSLCGYYRSRGVFARNLIITPEPIGRLSVTQLKDLRSIP
jgi:hypothetical protein